MTERRTMPCPECGVLLEAFSPPERTDVRFVQCRDCGIEGYVATSKTAPLSGSGGDDG